ncbi:beta-N-acetylglucosaminidase domain-containing protein [Pseudoflavonifractor capillosus]|uniref:beta-N-acetylglucosaminidase domain-containing protein n=1 Tax=Pseudoflavonifractor capillosus TaxID=106588 RepID=UPI00195A4B18|nr:beta-N-acetylglucosaminidase domain-containing protein [Pseudoflavonifractor capillosus]MBM6896632.1 beta-N-acetylglucosaminidase domain-containing protein [Pseudoflavonifractor capillosus]
MRRQNKRVSPDHLGRRLTAAALAVVMGAGCVTLAPFQAQAEGSGDTGYEIYPNPHVMDYGGDEYIVKTQVNVVFESGIDQYTKNRLGEVLELKGIDSYTTGGEIVSGKTNILVGIEGSSEYVDTYADENLGETTTENLFNKTDSYVLDNRDGVITVLGRDTDAAFYGLTTLYHVFTQMDSYTIQEFHVEDWADVASRGFIEGYYGNPWSTQDRVNLMTWGGYYKLNSYFYAPKDDPKHNAKWRELYTEEELETKIKPLADAGNASKCKFVFALHPFMYNGINASNYDDSLEVLKKKFEQTMEYGVRQIAVLADDAGVPGGNNEAGWGVYTRLMEDLTNWVSSEEMQEKYQGLKVVIPFCPNDYMGNGNSSQLQYLGKNMPETVPLVVTGGKVWGEVSQNFTANFKNGVGRGPYMWINWPCTDNSKQHLIMGGYDDFLQVGVNPANIQGIVLNPMQQSEPSKVAIFGNACYSWNIWESEAEADAAWDASFACVDHNTVIPNAASDALRELSKHMINQNMDSRVRVLQESVELKPILNSFKEKLTAGTVTVDDVNTVMAEFVKLQQAAQTYRAKAGNTDVMDQIVYWLDCWDDTTEAAIAYLNGVKAVLAGDTNAILQYNTQGKTAFDRSKTHGFPYVGTTQYAEVGVQHIVPFINTLATYVSQYAETAMDPSKVIANFITNRTDTPTGDVANIFDGSDSTGMTFKTPNAIAEGEYVGLLYNKVIDVNNIRITMQGQADHFEHSKLQYTTNGKEWVDIELREGENQFNVPRNQPFEISLKEDALPRDFQAMGVRLITTRANSGACWLDLREFQINAQDSEPEVTEGTYSTNRDRMNGTAWDVLNDGANGGASASEVWLSVASGADRDGLPAGSYIQYTLTEPMKLTGVTFAQGGSAAGDVITDGSIQYLDDEGNWQTIAEVNGDKVQTFDFSDEDITTTAVRVQNDAFKKIWWRVGEFNVEFSADTSSKPIEYDVIRTELWAVKGGNESNLYDGDDTSYVYYDPDGNGNPNNVNGDDFMVDQFLGYDLGKVAELASIHLVVGNSAKVTDKIVKYTIETSLTGEDGSWTAVPDYESYTGHTDAVDTLNIKLSEPIQARYIRVRNLERCGAWGYFSEFTVTEVPTGSKENLYTNVETNILSNKEDGQVSLTSGSATLDTNDYVGVDLGNIKAVTSVTISALPQGVELQTSMNGVTWTDYRPATDARYVRAVATADAVTLNLTQFVVNFEFIGEKAVESNFAIQDTSSDMRNNGTVKNVFDGDLSTLGMITGTQDVDKTITFDLGQTIHFSSLRYYIVETQLNYPRHVKFEVSANGEDWTEVLVIGDGDFENEWDNSVAKDMQDKTLYHDSKNPGYMYAEATGLDVDGRYIRVTPLSTYSHRWLGFSEIQINGGEYISPESNRDIVSTVVEEAGKIPSNALDGNYTTTYKPSEANDSFTYRISEPTGLTSVRLVQLGAVSNATVTARYVGEDTNVDMGTLSQAINEFILPAGKTLESITVTWTDTIPEIAEITTSTQPVASVDKDALKDALGQTQDTSTWTDNSKAAYEAAKKEAQAIAGNAYASQTMVDAALAALKNAIANKVIKATNVEGLQALVDNKVSNDDGFYTAVSYNAYTSAVSSLETALKDKGNLSQTQADELKSAVESAKAALVYSTTSRELAELAVEGYAALKAKNYTVDSYAAVTAAKDAIDTLAAKDKAAATNAERVNPAEFVKAKTDYENAVDALVNVADLNAELDKADEVNAELYTEDSYNAYVAAVDAGKALLQSGTQQAVDAAVAEIQAKYDALELKDGISLKNVIDQARALKGENYTTDSYAALMDVVAEAEKSGDNSYIIKIQDAMKALVNVEALKAQMAAAEAVDGEKYTTSSYKYLADLMAQVDALLKSGTQGQVDSMTTTLDSAIRALVARATGVDEYRDGITLKAADGYTAESYAAYKQAYDALMAADAADLTPEEFAQLKAAFEQAELALKVVEPVDPEEPGDNDKPEGNVVVDNQSGVQIVVGNADQVFAGNTVITVESVTEGKIFDIVKQALKDLVSDMKNTAILEITATLNGKPVQPNGTVQVTFQIPDHLSVDHLKLFYVAEDGTREEIPITVHKEGRTVTANLKHFSTYVLANVVVDEDGGKVPPTGDTSDLMSYVLVAAVCAAGIAALMFFKSKKKA